MRLTLRDQLGSKVLVLCLLLAAACSSDDSGKKGTTEDPATGDGDKGDGDTGDGDTDKGDGGKIDVPPVMDPITNDDGGTDPTGCTQGTTRECTCEDKTTMGTQLCVQGQFLPECSGCPCKAGDVQACFCA